MTFYLDQQSGLLLRRLEYIDTALGLNPTQIDYADFRTLDGLKVPFQETIARPNSRLTIQIEDAKVNVPVDETKFARPAAPVPARPSS